MLIFIIFSLKNKIPKMFANLFPKLENLHENIPLQFLKEKLCEDLLQKILDMTQEEMKLKL